MYSFLKAFLVLINCCIQKFSAKVDQQRGVHFVLYKLTSMCFLFSLHCFTNM